MATFINQSKSSKPFENQTVHMMMNYDSLAYFASNFVIKFHGVIKLVFIASIVLSVERAGANQSFSDIQKIFAKLFA